MQFFSRSKHEWVDKARAKLRARDISGIVVMGDVKGDIAQFGRDNPTELTTYTARKKRTSSSAWTTPPMATRSTGPCSR